MMTEQQANPTQNRPGAQALRRWVFGNLGIWVFLLGISAEIAASPVPTNLPPPDDTPPEATKPVKVYILSGQSNMVGFGTLKGGGRSYTRIHLSADPSVVPWKLPIGSTGILPHGVYQVAEGNDAGAKAFVYQGAWNPEVDYTSPEAVREAHGRPVKETTVALGTVSENLPSVPGPHTVVVHAYLEVPLSGMHEIHAGFEESAHAVVLLDGKEVYRKLDAEKATVEKVALEAGKRYPVTAVYMKGGKAAFWMQLVDIPAKGSLEALVEAGLFSWMANDDGSWTVRNDVIYNDAFLGGGKSKPLSPTANGRFFGPELGFGYVMGTFHDEPVMLIKSCTGNRSLAWDYLPPGSERYEVGDKIYAGYKDRQSSWPKEQGEPKAGGWYAGKQYDQSTAAIHKVLDNFDTLHPEFKDRGYEIAGFVWWQGHKDQNDVHASRYELNLINLMKAWRKEFNAPDAKWAIATIAFGGWKLGGAGKAVADAQLAVSDFEKYPEHKGKVKTIEARGFWRDVAYSPSHKGYHYNHNAETYMLTGDALGRAMVEMMAGTAEPGPTTITPPPVSDKPVAEMTLAEKARLLHSDPYLWTWSNDEREPTPAQIEAMQPAMRPFILASEIPDLVSGGYRTGGVSLTEMLSTERPKRAKGMTGQLDTLISLYNLAGIHDYDWKPFGPDMQNGEWWYFNYDPPEKLDVATSGRYREITLPEGMENWFTEDFNPAGAGWKKGHAPFGQNNGELAPLKKNCTNPQCGCSILPKTLWEKEVLLMRQTFKLPELKEGHRYRLVLGGASHAFSGEGYALYVNGKQFSQADSGFFKRGGTRGEILWSDWLPEFEKGDVTIAFMGFLRTTRWVNKAAPPRGHVSIWIEEVPIPEVVLDAHGKDAEQRLPSRTE